MCLDTGVVKVIAMEAGRVIDGVRNRTAAKAFLKAATRPRSVTMVSVFLTPNYRMTAVTIGQRACLFMEGR